ncbi:HAD family hydrolase [Flavobacterium sp.]|uniref:HAD family hydrolase n=1 Tax=Flavobacterium sp. TaxID=239 RepID=UPI0038FC4925
MKTNTLALFDFDKTLYKKDSLLEFTKFSKGNLNFFFGIMYLSPYLILMKLGILSNQNVKQKYFQHFFKNFKYDYFKAIAINFAVNEIEKKLSPKIYQEFQKHLKANHKIVIITASIPEWIAPWSAQFGVEVIGTRMEILDNKITGRFITNNCFGIEKVKRIKAIIDLEKFDEICVYGSGKGDLEMLQLSKKTI